MMRWLILALLAVLAGFSAGRREDCSEFGFVDPSEVPCSACDRLAKAFGAASEEIHRIQGEEMVAVCAECCTGVVDDEDDSERAASAVLISDMFYLERLAPLAAFVEKRARDFPNLKVVDKWARKPELVLRNADGKRVMTISVETWEEQQLVEFLKEKLAQ